MGGSWKKVSAGAGYTCAITNSNSLRCWGSAGSYIGDGILAQLTVPREIASGGIWKSASVGGYTTCGIKSDDTGWCWGRNSYGQLGDGTITNASVVTPISGGGTWKQLWAGNIHTCGIKSDDTAWCWGYNSNGALGDTTTTNRNVPTAVSGGGTWKQIRPSTGNGFSEHTCGIKSDDTLWCWGSNGNGITGLNTAAGNTLTPTQVNGGGIWKHVTVGYDTTCAIKSDDSLWCWGNNGSNQLGDGTTTQRLIPTAVSGGGTWKQVEGFQQFGCGTKTDDTLWCWGFWDIHSSHRHDKWRLIQEHQS